MIEDQNDKLTESTTRIEVLEMEITAKKSEIDNFAEEKESLESKNKKLRQKFDDIIDKNRETTGKLTK
jgi:cell division protein FtsB